MKPGFLIEKMDRISPWISRNVAGWLVLAVAAAGMTGCATAPDGSATETAGWKTGWVNKITEGKDLKNIQERECVAALPSDQIARSRFAVVWYPKGRGRQPRTVPIPDSSDLKVGDAVRINVLDCAAPISRIPQ